MVPVDAAGAPNDIPLKGPRPGLVLASTFRGEDRSIYVVDEVALGPLKVARLLRIELATGQSHLIGAWPRLRKFDRTFLSVSDRGDLLIAASSAKKNVTLRAHVRSNGTLAPKWMFAAPGALAYPPKLTQAGLTLPLQDASGAHNRFVHHGDLPAGGKAEWAECF